MGRHKYTTEEFIELVKQKWGFDYDYSQTVYTKSCEPVKIICHIHGMFEQMANDHVSGSGCPKCGMIFQKRNKTTEDFIHSARKKHGRIYNYSHVNYVDMNTNITIVCKKHKEFVQTPKEHLSLKTPCPKCRETKRSKPIKTADEFIRTARMIHCGKYDYSLIEYKTINDEVRIICPVHGETRQIARNHLKSCGCLECAKEKIRQKFIRLENKW